MCSWRVRSLGAPTVTPQRRGGGSVIGSCYLRAYEKSPATNNIPTPPQCHCEKRGVELCLVLVEGGGYLAVSD